MAHFLLSLMFLAMLILAAQSIWHDMTRTLVARPLDDGQPNWAPALRRAPAHAPRTVTARSRTASTPHGLRAAA